MVKGQSPRQLLELYVAVMQELRDRKFVRSANQPVGDIAELLVAAHFNVELLPQSTRGYDLRTRKEKGFPNGRRIEVKARRVAPPAKASHYSFLRGLDSRPPPFDTLVAVHFDNRFDVVDAWEIPFRVVREKAGPISLRTGGQRLALIKETDLVDPRIEAIQLPSIDEVDPSRHLLTKQSGETDSE